MLGDLYREWEALPDPPEVEWPRMRSLEFQEALREHEVLIRNLGTFTCVNDPEFDAQVGQTDILRRLATDNTDAWSVVCYRAWREGPAPAHR